MITKRHMRMKRTLIIIAAILAFLVAVGAAASFMLLRHYKNAAEYLIGQALGAGVEMASLSVNLKDNTLRMTDFRLHNPAGFTEDPLMAFLPEITGKFDRKTLFMGRKLHFTELYLYVKTVIFIRNKDGELNIDRLAVFKDDFKALPISTDRMRLTSDFAVYKDLSKGRLPHTETFDIGIRDVTYEGFPTMEDLTKKVFSEIMKRTTIRGAGIAGVALLAGAVGGWPVVIPAGAAVLLSEKDGYQKTFEVGYDDAYAASMEAAKALGKTVHEQKEKGLISGNIDGAGVKISVRDAGGGKTEISVSARKNLMPERNIAGGVLYEIAQRLVAGKKI